MKKLIMSLLVLGLSALAPQAAGAAGQSIDIEGKWSLSLRGGMDFPIDGDAHGSGMGTVLGLPTTVMSKGWDDVYEDITYRIGIEVGYGVWEWGEVIARVSYASVSSDRLQVGDVATLPLLAKFDDYEETAVEFGYRHYFINDNWIKPYATGVLGMKFVKGINATLTVPAASVVLPDVDFYDDTTVFAGGLDIGVRFDVAEMVAVGVETGLRYQSDLDEIEGLAGTGLENINDSSDRMALGAQFFASLLW